MKQTKFISLLLLTVAYVGGALANDLTCGTCPGYAFVPRSQNDNTARRLIGMQEKIYPYDADDYSFVGSLALEYQHSLDSGRLAKSIFGDDSIHFLGSQVATAGGSSSFPCCALIADYFGLSAKTDSTLKLEPVIQNLTLDAQLFVGLDKIKPGLYAKVHVPFAYSDVHIDNSCTSPLETTPFPECYMSTTGIASVHASLTNALEGKPFGDVPQWKHGRFPFCHRGKFRVADVDLNLGYNFSQDEDSHVGIFARVVVPTGNKPHGTYIAEPRVGNGHHWEAGLGLSAHSMVWHDGDQSLGIYFDGNVTHVFKAEETRFFDFKHRGRYSRYLLLKEFDANLNLIGIMNAIDWTTRQAQVHVDCKGDATLKFAYSHNNWGVDAGYNIYGRKREHGSVCGFADCDVKGRNFGIKGNEGVCCQNFIILNGNPVTISGPVNPNFENPHPRLNSTHHDATICDPTTPYTTDNKQTTQTLSGRACFTWDSVTAVNTTYIHSDGQKNSTGVIVAQTSNPPILISDEDLDCSTGFAGGQITHKFFGQFNYVFEDYKSKPFLGIGGSVEFAQIGEHNGALEQWGLLIKGGLTF